MNENSPFFFIYFSYRENLYFFTQLYTFTQKIHKDIYIIKNISQIKERISLKITIIEGPNTDEMLKNVYTYILQIYREKNAGKRVESIKRDLKLSKE